MKFPSALARTHPCDVPEGRLPKTKPASGDRLPPLRNHSPEAPRIRKVGCSRQVSWLTRQRPVRLPGLLQWLREQVSAFTVAGAATAEVSETLPYSLFSCPTRTGHLERVDGRGRNCRTSSQPGDYAQDLRDSGRH